ncbi:hypothetical protein PsorP6_012134 [Peronosclerospora sorghi]|uniref:Uncharacterized protein n=1 Tax=Peronosclerospora sorghi TaxID=230839 RepID=A0ACC0WLT0_9STRA|nr:hypothetical protein PsorP6_012134 [Peronosclerospora sorghi]
MVQFTEIGSRCVTDGAHGDEVTAVSCEFNTRNFRVVALNCSSDEASVSERRSLHAVLLAKSLYTFSIVVCSSLVQLTSVALCGWDNIRQVDSWQRILAVLPHDGIVLSCGLKKSSQWGQGHFDERVMSFALCRLIALTDSGHAYSWGYNDRGQLRHENLATKICVPKPMKSLKDKN